jgi:hypothetical protein
MSLKEKGGKRKGEGKGREKENGGRREKGGEEREEEKEREGFTCWIVLIRGVDAESSVRIAFTRSITFYYNMW